LRERPYLTQASRAVGYCGAKHAQPPRLRQASPLRRGSTPGDQASARFRGNHLRTPSGDVGVLPGRLQAGGLAAAPRLALSAEFRAEILVTMRHAPIERGSLAHPSETSTLAHVDSRADDRPSQYARAGRQRYGTGESGACPRGSAARCARTRTPWWRRRRFGLCKASGRASSTPSKRLEACGAPSRTTCAQGRFRAAVCARRTRGDARGPRAGREWQGVYACCLRSAIRGRCRLPRGRQSRHIVRAGPQAWTTRRGGCRGCSCCGDRRLGLSARCDRQRRK
jgi:hypothetical protein